jgi:hypothetical protein
LNSKGVLLEKGVHTSYMKGGNEPREILAAVRNDGKKKDIKKEVPMK